ncbi:hypothetical protein E2C01_042781 [Portunus trituberculatus]|uniref:Uncharacterized protein n=1 Tax=Portunus trituberculatus TaxID=210409 RepID=A0A5B7FXF8_PORTR|nr:hypothetical protein [Portunus trituberculatus]
MVAPRLADTPTDPCWPCAPPLRSPVTSTNPTLPSSDISLPPVLPPPPQAPREPRHPHYHLTSLIPSPSYYSPTHHPHHKHPPLHKHLTPLPAYFLNSLPLPALTSNTPSPNLLPSHHPHSCLLCPSSVRRRHTPCPQAPPDPQNFTPPSPPPPPPPPLHPGASLFRIKYHRCSVRYFSPVIQTRKL